MPFDDPSLSICYLFAEPLLHSGCVKHPQAISGIAGGTRIFQTILQYWLWIGLYSLWYRT